MSRRLVAAGLADHEKRWSAPLAHLDSSRDTPVTAVGELARPSQQLEELPNPRTAGSMAAVKSDGLFKNRVRAGGVHGCDHFGDFAAPPDRRRLDHGYRTANILPDFRTPFHK